jgi:hypothetical protein
VKTFDVQSVAIAAPIGRTFEYIADPQNLPEWTHAFQSITPGRARMVTPQGSIEIGLSVDASPEMRTVDWTMKLPDGSVGKAYSRIHPDGNGGAIYTFLLMAPPVPLEQLEGALEQQSITLRDELQQLARILGGRRQSRTR